MLHLVFSQTFLLSSTQPHAEESLLIHTLTKLSTGRISSGEWSPWQFPHWSLANPPAAHCMLPRWGMPFIQVLTEAGQLLGLAEKMHQSFHLFAQQ